MPRPCKQRCVTSLPAFTGFQPRASHSSAQRPVDLMVDELEALRLADVEGLSQEEGATRMNISRATFGRILEHAHFAVADALIHGKPLHIGGGQVITSRHQRLQCRQCRKGWDVPRVAAATFRCPRCRVEETCK